jgi:flavodoxin
MISIDLPATLEKRFWKVVRDSYDGDLETAMTAFLKLHEKCGWKEQFLEDVESIRAEMRRQGGIKEETIENAVQRYRRNLGVSGA